MTNATADDSPGSTRTVDRALTLLTTLLEGTSGSTLTELARATGLSPSTASRLLSTLVGHQLVGREADGRFRAGPRMKQIAAATLREDPIYDLAGPHLHALVEETGEPSSLGVAAGEDRVLYLRQVASGHQVQTADWTGRTIPRTATALGAALDGSPSPRGFVTSRRPGSDVAAVAAPVIGREGQVVAALSINAPAYRTSDADLERYGRAIVKHAVELSLALGAPVDRVGR